MKVIGKAGRVRQKIYHAIGVGIGERLEQNRVHHGEDSCVGSDAECQCCNDSGSETGVLEEHLEREFDVTPEIAHPLTPFST